MALILNGTEEIIKTKGYVLQFSFSSVLQREGDFFFDSLSSRVFRSLFMMHGLDKMTNFSVLSESYPSIMGFGSYMTLMISIFAELCCSLFLITGLLVRITVLPMIVAMAVAFFDVHDAMMPEGELAFIYLIIFIILYATGPGRYSLDYLIDTKVQAERTKR